MRLVVQILLFMLIAHNACAEVIDYKQMLLDQANEIKSLRNRVDALEMNLETLLEQNDCEITKPITDIDLVNQEEVALENLSAQDHPESVKLLISSDRAAYDLALADLKDRDFASAEQKFAAFINDFPNSNLQSNAYFWYADSFYQRGLFDKSALIYMNGYKKFPNSSKATDYLLKAAYSLASLNKKGDACTLLKKIEDDFPKQDFHSKKKVLNAKTKFMCNKIYY
ncbi:MAG: hypothetical protein DGJ47_000750 [Rickettsiaceae bacterium]